ncbi:hypothetical protein AVEN_122023-1 [Araneus ventricosus]|uniref:Uncharacterized protein n=1 Tax=Araneus ventricosus TaxID=182803 RepID=A0A4Y2VFB7_ARAVE|nr:hypothetical protein AVEN_246672-1 [Araneus ventricosus]GBO22836.1 hypothetical protein AVEN_122023-1 [Araneus ventricosus]
MNQCGGGDDNSPFPFLWITDVATSVPTKIRLNFNVPALETEKNSLNDLLYKDPNSIEQIPDITDRFRSYPIRISADIEKEFLQLGIVSEHRYFLRFFYPTENVQIVY